MKTYFTIFLLFAASLAFGQTPTNVSAQTKTPRVYLEATYGHVYVSGVDHAVPRLEAYGHNQTMELAKTFQQRCPEVLLTTNEDKADFKVTRTGPPARGSSSWAKSFTSLTRSSLPTRTAT